MKTTQIYGEGTSANSEETNTNTPQTRKSMETTDSEAFVSLILDKAEPNNIPSSPVALEIQLIKPLWRSPDLCHLIGVFDRTSKKFRNIPVKDAD